MGNELEDARWARESLQLLLDHTERLLALRAGGAGTSVLIEETADLKFIIKAANRTRKFRGRKMPLDGPARFLASAIQRASADFRMRTDTDPAKAEWARTLGELRSYFADYIGRIRKECPEVE